MEQNQPWLAQDVVAILGDMHDLPKIKIKKFIMKYDLETNQSLEDTTTKKTFRGGHYPPPKVGIGGDS